MIGERIESGQSIGVAPILLGLAAFVLVGFSLMAGSPHLAVFAILPFALAIAAFVSGESPVAFTITEEGLAFEQPDLDFVRYSELGGITAPVSRNPGNHFAIQIHHTTGAVRIPPDLNISSRDLYDFLVERLPPLEPADPDAVPSGLRAFVAEQIQLFGVEKVFVYHARPFPPRPSYSRKLAYAVATICAAVAWFVVGIILEGTKKGEGAVWAGFGCMISFLGLLFAFTFLRANARGWPRNWRDACLVVSPGSIAMVQGKLRGKLRWDELRAIDYPAKPRFGLSTHGGARRGLGLLTDGAYFIVADLYVRPLADIRRALDGYWGGRDAN
jgi:hypothetical protein